MKILLITLAMVWSGMAFSNEKTRLVMNEHFRGQNELSLKHLAEEKSDLNSEQISKNKVIRIVLIAKSKQGKGKAILFHQNSRVAAKIIKKSGNFSSNANSSYLRIVFNTPEELPLDQWHIKLSGNIKVKAIVFVSKEPDPIRYNASCRAYGKIGFGQQTFYGTGQALSSGAAINAAVSDALSKCRGTRGVRVCWHHRSQCRVSQN